MGSKMNAMMKEMQTNLMVATLEAGETQGFDVQFVNLANLPKRVRRTVHGPDSVLLDSDVDPIAPVVVEELRLHKKSFSVWQKPVEAALNPDNLWTKMLQYPYHPGAIAQFRKGELVNA